MRKFHIKKGDIVYINAGKDKGKTGRVLMVDTAKERAVVEGYNFMVKRSKPSAKNPQGGMIKVEAGIHISNLNPVDPKTGKPTRISRQRVEKDGKTRSVRVAKKSGEELK